MTYEIAAVLVILTGAVLLFITEWVRMDIVALMVLVILALSGLVTPTQALSGFSNMSVITVWAMLILSAGLAKSGVAHFVGGKVIQFAGGNHVRLVILIMVTAGLLSAFMNNIAVAAFMLPAVIDMSNRTGISSSKLLIPLAFACLLGGLSTMIGTPSNILISESLQVFGIEPFGMFDYTPIGLIMLTTGVLFITIFGYRLLPIRSKGKIVGKEEDYNNHDLFSIDERIFVVNLDKGSALNGKSLADSKLSAILGINVIAISRNGKTILSPASTETLHEGDQLIVSGRQEEILKISGKDQFIVGEQGISLKSILSDEVYLVEIEIGFGDPFARKTVEQIDFRKKYGVNVLAVDRDGVVKRTNLQGIKLVPGDKVLIQGSKSDIRKIEKETRVSIKETGITDLYRISERLLAIQIPTDSRLIGENLESSKLGDAFGLNVLGIRREEGQIFAPNPDQVIQEDDTLLVEGNPEDIDTILGLRDISFTPDLEFNLQDLVSDQVGFVEVVLSPRSTMHGKNLRQANFREKFGVTVIAVWREGIQYRSNLRDFKLRYGDALLLYGPREKFKFIGEEMDFIVLTEAAYEAPKMSKTITAVLVMVMVIIPVIAGWIPIAVSALIGIILMILTGCLTMEEAYRSIEWKAVFLIAGLIPLGIALEQSGAAEMLAESMISMIGVYGPLAVTAGLFIMTAVAAQIIPNAAVALLIAPIAYNTAMNLDISPYPLFMTVAVAASAAFLTPVGHPANLLVVGPGGYKFSDFFKIGVPLLIVVFVLLMITLQIFWPFN